MVFRLTKGLSPRSLCLRLPIDSLPCFNRLRQDAPRARPRPTPYAMADGVRSIPTAEGGEARGASLSARFSRYSPMVSRCFLLPLLIGTTDDPLVERG